ncbi:MAG: hypothetical protein IT329_08190 [Caldilineaceae bacterium]|nr:hypothetical protein [Caldilineaceae bacterium]
MELHEYPRPANDTGIGVHWAAGFASAIGIGRIRDHWIPEMKAMGIKWVKIFNHDGAIDFAELLLSEGIMPIVRIYRPSPNPSTLDIREIVHLDAFIRAGVHYFEFNHEPDQDSEWKGGRVPANGIDLVVENTIANMELILERGGMPGVPAVANGSRWDLVGKIVGRGRKDLFNGPVWHAIHNYGRNRPLDYPYDSGSQEGSPYTQRFYQAIAGESWGEDAWRGRSLQAVNKLRLERCNPGATVMDDHACWLAYEFFDARNRRHLGRSIPILSTEGGYLVGEDVDPRYPATTPDLHLAQTLEACRIMMGSSSRYQPAPDYYFASAFWLLGNAVLGSASAWCEHHAWVSERWPGGALPIARALKAEPKVVRRWQGATLVGARATLHGTVLHAGDRRTVILEKGGAEVARTVLDANSRYMLPDLLPGNYTLRVDGALLEQPVSLLPDQEDATVNLDLAESTNQASGSTLGGTVRGGAGAVVMLLRTSDGEEWVTMAKDDGSFRFVDLPPGTYNVRVQGGGSHLEGITLDGRNRRQVDLATTGWGYTVRPLEEPPAQPGMIYCAVDGYLNLPVQVFGDEWSSAQARTGAAPEIGEFACAIGPVEPGYYGVTVDGLMDSEGRLVKLEAYVQTDRRSAVYVEFVYSGMTPPPDALPRASNIRGRVIGGCTPDRPLHVWLLDDQANRQEQRVGPDCTFIFEGLGRGLYAVQIVGYADVASRSDIALDGKNIVEIELFVPLDVRPQGEFDGQSGQSVIAGAAPDAAGRPAKLVDSVGNEVRQLVGANNTFCFEGLAAGVYTLSVEGGYLQSELTLDGGNALEVIFQPLVATWEVTVSPAGSMPGYSVVRVEVEGMRGLPVYIWKEDWEGMMRRTGSKPEYGECSAEFSPLGPGHYMLEPEGLGVWADMQLTGLEVVWVDFRRKGVPTSPHVVRPWQRQAAADDDHRPAAAPEAWEPGGFDDEWTGDEWAGESLPFEPEAAFDVSPSDEPPFDESRFDESPIDPTPSEAASFEEVGVEEPSSAAPSFEADSADAGAVDTSAAVTAAPGAGAPKPAAAPPYLLLVDALTDLADQIALLRFVAQVQPVIVARLEETLNADYVILLGRSPAADEAEQRLSALGIAYERVNGRPAEVFAGDDALDLD